MAKSQTWNATQFVRTKQVREAELAALRDQRSAAKAQRTIEKLAQGPGPVVSAPAPERFDTVTIQALNAERVAQFHNERLDGYSWLQLREEVRKNEFEIGVVRRQLGDTQDERSRVRKELQDARAALKLAQDTADGALAEYSTMVDRNVVLFGVQYRQGRALYATRAWCIAACLLAALLVYPFEPWRAVALCLAGALGPFVPALLTWRKGGEP